MSALRSALLECGDRIGRILVAGVAVFLATHLTEGFLVGLGATVAIAAVLNALRWGAGRFVERSADE